MVDSQWSPGYDKVLEAVVDMRTRAGLTQRELAEKVGREQSFIGRIETRQRRIDLVEFIWIARCCGLDPEQEVAAIVKHISRSLPG
jgi:transcriptional regulator with XRE-family HTH domain